MFQATYVQLKKLGFSGAELTLLDGQGRVLVDYNPSNTGTTDVVCDYNVIRQLNLAEKGVAVTQTAVKGQAGFSTAMHARKKIRQIGGYAHLEWTLGYPGMN